MTALMVASELGQARPDHAMDWNETVWIVWWSLTAVATLLFVVGVRSAASRTRIRKCSVGSWPWPRWSFSAWQ